MVDTGEQTPEVKQAAPSRGSGCARSLISFLIMLAIILVSFWFIRSFIVGTYEIPSGSMEETIQVGDRVFSERISYYFNEVQPGEIVTFHKPEFVGGQQLIDEDETYIKRCIAVGGQTVNLVNGQVYVDGIAQDEPYTDGKPSYPLQTAPGVSISYPYTVPDGYLWVMGDNRTNSSDSRYFGAIPETSVTGKAFFIYWPFEDLGLLE